MAGAWVTDVLNTSHLAHEVRHRAVGLHSLSEDALGIEGLVSSHRKGRPNRDDNVSISIFLINCKVFNG